MDMVIGEPVNTLKDEMDEENYVYLLCDCPFPIEEAIRIKRPKKTEFIKVKCPRCGREDLAIVALGKESD